MLAQFLVFHGKFLHSAERREISLWMQKLKAPFLSICLSVCLSVSPSLQVLFALNQTLLQHEGVRAGSLQGSYTTEDLITHYNCGDLSSIIFNHDTSQVGQKSSHSWSSCLFQLRLCLLVQLVNLKQLKKKGALKKSNTKTIKKNIIWIAYKRSNAITALCRKLYILYFLPHFPQLLLEMYLGFCFL